jgi:hypothetical protein
MALKRPVLSTGYAAEFSPDRWAAVTSAARVLRAISESTAL